MTSGAEALPQRPADVLVGRFLADLQDSRDWLDALLEAVALWTVPEETLEGRVYRYLVGGEAFDWLMLAERLLLSTDGLIPPAERDDLLFDGLLPRAMMEEEFKEAVGPAKYGAIVNYWYGVTVEEALLLAVEHEVRKQRRGLSSEDSRLDDAVYERIYGPPQEYLLNAFFSDSGILAADGISLAQLNELTYWLFKYRVKNSDPARLASDTRKGLRYLESQGRMVHGR